MSHSGYARSKYFGLAASLLLAAFAGAPCRAIAATADTWSLTGNLPGVRFWHAAVLLKTGKVLVSGGIDQSYTVTSTAELYDPTSGTWVTTGSMHVAREFHSLVLLNDGKVLASGGSGADQNGIAQAELYDPSSGGWTLTGSLNTARVFNETTLLENGSVLASGGEACEYCSDGLNGAEIYDPTSGSWSVTGSMAQGRYSHTATRLSNGMVLVAGGCGGPSCTPLDSTEAYDPESGSWLPEGSLHTVRAQASANLLRSGKVLAAGGFGSDGNPISSTELFDPTTGTWRLSESMSVERTYQVGLMLPNGDILQGGGFALGGYSTGDTELYQPLTGLWTTVGSLATPVYGAAGVVLPDGSVLVTGGVDFTGVATSQVYTEGASPLLSLSSTSPDFGSPLVGTSSEPQKILVGNTGQASLSIATISIGSAFSETDDCAGKNLAPGASCAVTAIYTPSEIGTQTATLQFQDNAPGGSQAITLSGVGTDKNWKPRSEMTYARAFHTASLLQDGNVLIAGGGCNNDSLFYSLPSLTELYDVKTGQLQLSGSMIDARGSHTATVLTDGSVLAAGGCNGATALATAELYNPGTGVWTLTMPMSVARSSHTATFLGNGNVLVAGGGTATAELYDPSTGAWTVTGAMHVSRTAQTATLLASGTVLVAGGGSNTAELYDPNTGIWTVTGSMSTDRSNHTATLLASGQVLVAGGSGSGKSFLASAELYDASAGTWMSTGSMKKPRTGHAANLLASDKVLVEGGEFYCDPETGCSDTPSAEIYDPTTGLWSMSGQMTTPRQNHTATLLPGSKVLVTGGSGYTTEEFEAQ